MREYEPKRHRYIYVEGWEPLGNLCNTDYAKTEATPYLAVEPQGGNAGQWHGLWGRHYFTPANLQLRAMAYWNRWSEDWAGFDFIQFYGGYIYIPQTAPTTWMINFDQYLQVKLKNYDPQVTEDKWCHPGILLNDPKTHIIYPPSTYKRQKYYKVRVTAPPGWKGLTRLPDAEAYVCLHWCWTWCNLQTAFFNEPDSSHSQSACEITPWWAKNNYTNRWANRQTYKECTQQTLQEEKTWGPFLPCKYNGFTECSLWFKYRLRFKVAGYSIWPTLPHNIVSSGLVPNPPGVDGQSDSTKANKKRHRPQSAADIWPGDLDSDGLLKERAYKRITEHNRGDFRSQLERERRLRHLSKKLTILLDNGRFFKRRRLGDATPPDPPTGGDK